MKIDLLLTTVVFFHLPNVGNGESWSPGWVPKVNTPYGAGKIDVYEKKSNGLLDTLTRPYLQKVTKPLPKPKDLVSKAPNSLPDVPDVPCSRCSTDILSPIVGPVTDIAKSVKSISNAFQQMLNLIPTLTTLFQQLKVLGQPKQNGRLAENCRLELAIITTYMKGCPLEFSDNARRCGCNTQWADQTKEDWKSLCIQHCAKHLCSCPQGTS